jgi:hypothetical protein
LNRTRGPRCKFHGIYYIWDLFLYKEIRRPGLWVLSIGGERVHRGPTKGGRQELASVERTDAPGRGGLLRKLGEREGNSAELTEVGVGWRNGGVVPVTKRIGGGGQSSTSTAFRARRGGDDEGNALWRWRSGCCTLL